MAIAHPTFRSFSTFGLVTVRSAASRSSFPSSRPYPLGERYGISSKRYNGNANEEKANDPEVRAAQSATEFRVCEAYPYTRAHGWSCVARFADNRSGSSGERAVF
jgi:hypothetical protein